MEKSQEVFFFYPEGSTNSPRRVIAGIFDEENGVIIIGKSECSLKDKFNKAKGRAIALGRARCTRPLKVKEFIQKGQTIKTNEDILPTSFKVDPSESPLHQFIQLAKTL